MAFYNIFSAKNEKPKKADEIKLKILVDNHEKNSLVPSNLSKLGVPFEFKHLEVGDYLISDIIIERKTFSDLQSSIMDKRILAQLENMKQYPKSLLIIEGEMENQSKIIHENAIKGFILSTLLNTKIPIIFTKDEEETAQYLYVLAKRLSKKETEVSLIAKRLSTSTETQKQFIIESFPGIGPTTAKKLLKHFKSIKAIVNAPNEELTKLIGKKADIFKQLLD